MVSVNGLPDNIWTVTRGENCWLVPLPEDGPLYCTLAPGSVADEAAKILDQLTTERAA